MAGIVGYGAYIPRNRIKVEEIAKVWGADAPSYKKGLMLEEKSVPSPDQDTITMSVEASKKAIKRAGIDPARDRRGLRRIGIASLRGQADRDHSRRGHRRHARRPHGRSRVRLQGRLGGHVHRPQARRSRGDQVRPGRRRGHVPGRAGRRARILRGRRAPPPSSSARTTSSPRPSTRTRTRRIRPISGAASTSTTRCHGGRFTGEPAYFKHVIGAANGIMSRFGAKPSDFQYVIFHQPNGKFPLRAGEILGFTRKQIDPGWLVPKLGNTYSGSSPLGLTATLDIAKPGDTHPDGLLRLGRGQRRLHLAGDRSHRPGPGPGRQDARDARQQQELPRLRRVRQVPPQDPQGGGVGGGHERCRCHRRRHDQVGRALGEVAPDQLHRNRPPRPGRRGRRPRRFDGRRLHVLRPVHRPGAPRLAPPRLPRQGPRPGDARRVGLLLGRPGPPPRLHGGRLRAERHRPRRRRREDDRRHRRARRPSPSAPRPTRNTKATTARHSPPSTP